MANALGVPSPDKAAYMDNVAAVAVTESGCIDGVTESGCIDGVDIDPRMVDAANERFREHPRIEIHLGDGHALLFEDATFDRARMDRGAANSHAG